MLLFWRIRYLDSRDRQFKDRDLWLDTATLDPVTKAAVETTYDLDDSRRRSMLRHRALFREERPDESSIAFGGGFCVSDYFEDEVGQELSLKRMAGIAHGPHPGTIVASRDMNWTDELAVMVDTVQPLLLTRQAVALDDPQYPLSWSDG